MNERLANVIHWTANFLALLLLFIGAVAAWNETLYGTFGQDDITILCAILASVAWLSGWICHYALADRN